MCHNKPICTTLMLQQLPPIIDILHYGRHAIFEPAHSRHNITHNGLVRDSWLSFSRHPHLVAHEINIILRRVFARRRPALNPLAYGSQPVHPVIVLQSSQRSPVAPFRSCESKEYFILLHWSQSLPFSIIPPYVQRVIISQSSCTHCL